jgi:hypothetical protein
LGIVLARKIEPAGRPVKRFVEKSWFCLHLTKSGGHSIGSLGRLEWRHGCLLKSRRHPANGRWHLWVVCMDLTTVGGHLSPVDAASTVVATASSNADTLSSAVETAWLKVDVSPVVAAFALSAVGISLMIATAQ